MPEEVRFFGRLSIYALIIGAVYWFLSYDAAGTVLLIGFGFATGVAFLVLWRSGRRDDPGAIDRPDVPDGPFGDESAPVPTRSAAPLALGFGVAVMALAGAFGPWFLIAGAVPLVLGATDWLRSASRELSQAASADATGRNPAAEGGGRVEPVGEPADARPGS
jgi:Cytochrome c oxidase subunit IV